MAETAKLQLFVKASEDGESVGHCPSCQRLFMILLLKGVPFTLTTVDTRRCPDVLKDFAPGSQLPILLYDGEAKTDTLQIEEFLEETLGPPEFPSLAPRYRESTAAGNDVFHKFSAFIKNPLPAQDDGEEGLEPREAGGGVAPQALTSPSPRPSPVPAAAARPRQAGWLPARAPGARAGTGAAAARVPPPLSGRRPAHAGGLRPAAQAARRERERRRDGTGRAGRTPEETLTAPSARRRCARTSARRPSPRSCVASAATWTAPCRRKSSSTRARTAPRSWRPTGPPCAPASARLRRHGAHSPAAPYRHRLRVCVGTSRPPGPQGLPPPTATVSRAASHHSPEGQAERPVCGPPAQRAGAVRDGVRDAGTGLGSQTSQARAGRQDGRGGWELGPGWARAGLHSSVLPQVAGRQAGHPHLPQDLLSSSVWGLHQRGRAPAPRQPRPALPPPRPAQPPPASGLARQEQATREQSLGHLFRCCSPCPDGRRGNP
uniref:Chloride intracellular channel 3 n=1 Tax=Sus scrofa TaxID=9823 RepID=A0A8D0VST8_PIG